MSLLDQLVVRTMRFVPRPVVARISRNYIAGDNLADALRCVRRLDAGGFRATLDILGEFVTDLSQARRSLDGYRQVLRALSDEGLDANLSVKPTFFGLLLDRAQAAGLLTELADDVAAADNFLRLDMEDSTCTTHTLDIYRDLRERVGRHRTGVVLQAYLKRTLDDIAALTADGPAHFRLCKGIYVEPADVALQDHQEIRDNYLSALRAMLESGSFVGIATHDDWLADRAEAMLREMGTGPEQYEFQMLLGVREKLRDRIRGRGHPVRVYVPFGEDWYGYSVRRLKENPAMAGTVFKAMFRSD